MGQAIPTLINSDEYTFKCSFKLNILKDKNDQVGGIVEWIITDDFNDVKIFTSNISIRNNEIVSYFTVQKNNSYSRNVCIDFC